MSNSKGHINKKLCFQWQSGCKRENQWQEKSKGSYFAELGMMGMMVRGERRKRSQNRKEGIEGRERDEDQQKGRFGASFLRHCQQFRSWSCSVTVSLLHSDSHSDIPQTPVRYNDIMSVFSFFFFFFLLFFLPLPSIINKAFFIILLRLKKLMDK